LKAADLIFSRKDVEDEENDNKENDLRTKCTIELLDILDRISDKKKRKIIIIMSLSEKYEAEQYDEHQGIPFFFASDRINKLLVVE